MKFFFIYLFLFLIICAGFTDEDLLWSPYEFNRGNDVILISDNNVICSFWTSIMQLKIYKNNLVVEDGYLKVDDPEKSDKIYILKGKYILIIERYTFLWDWETNALRKKQEYLSTLAGEKYFSLDQWHQKKYYHNTEVTINKNRGHGDWDQVYLFNDGVKQINASSFLEETLNDGTLVSYSAQNIKDSLFFLTGDGTLDLLYDNITPPWVEGVEGYGIGEYLDIEFKYASDEIQILNGFVDFSRMHLYKDNSRVKRLLIESVEPAFKQEYELEDVVRYNVISLPRKTAKIRMTILDVYPGRKWQDTCISSILVTDPNQPPYEEQKAKIIALMKKNGVWEKIEDYKRQLK